PRRARRRRRDAERVRACARVLDRQLRRVRRAAQRRLRVDRVQLAEVEDTPDPAACQRRRAEHQRRRSRATDERPAQAQAEAVPPAHLDPPLHAGPPPAISKEPSVLPGPRRGYAPWHFLNFFPEPHQHGSLRPILSWSETTRWRVATLPPFEPIGVA